ncbi:MAG TPA: DUF4214 domain-containing protein [Pseudomonas sp.]|jgi:Ca2+-binding RTX toxin-like protein|uniref:DUF4214 domain-containing protein n=1 Tax=Pseudomonas sp. TaxID=306 RepID=UPI002ED861B4
MAIVNLYQPLDMTDIEDWEGYISVADATHIKVTDGFKVQDYFGDFQYGYDGLAGGTLTATTGYQNGLYFSVSDFSVSALQMESYIDNGYISAALNAVLGGHDTVYGSAGNDLIVGYGGDDSLFGNAGNDRIVSGIGNDFIDGGSGIDTVTYTTGKSSVQVSANGTGFVVVNNQGEMDTLVNVERLAFSDGTTLALDVKAADNTGSAYRLYQAAFDRTPDTAGLKYWIAEMDAGRSIGQIAQSFVDSSEFKTLNPGQDQNSIINNYYLHVLHRVADAPGYAYWNQQMANGMKANEVLVSFSESQENIANAAPSLEGGLWLG